MAALVALYAAACRSLFTLDESREQEPAPVEVVAEPIVVAAWAEPSSLPEGGGQTQLLVRVQKKGGTPFPGVQVRLAASTGTLFSAGRILVTDGRGMTRDRLTTRQSARVVLNAGGTHHRFDVRVGDSVDATPPVRRRSGGVPQAGLPMAGQGDGVSAAPRSPAPRSAHRAAAVPSR